MRPEGIRVGMTLRGKSADADKTREVLEINPKRREALTRVRRDGRDLGTGTISLHLLAQWAAGEVSKQKI